MSLRQCHRDKFVYTCCTLQIKWPDVCGGRSCIVLLREAVVDAVLQGHSEQKEASHKSVELANTAVRTTQTHTHTVRSRSASFCLFLSLCLSHTCWQGLASRWVLKYLKLKSARGGSEWSAEAKQIKLNYPTEGDHWETPFNYAISICFFLSVHKIRHFYMKTCSSEDNAVTRWVGLKVF